MGYELGVLSAADRCRLEQARGEFDADVIYLDTTTLGLPPRRSWQALQNWRSGP